jgi:hypothetical protein
VKSWIDDNKPLVIGLSAGIGGLLVLAILSCLIRCFRGPRKQKKRHHHRPRHTGGWNGAQGFDGPMPPPMTQRGGSGWYDGGAGQGGGEWVDSQNAGGWRSSASQPHYPPPSYGYTSVRYA